MVVNDERGERIAELEQLYRQHLPEFVRVATAISGDADRGSDAVQEGFTQAVRSIDGFRGDGTLAAWVWRIVVNAARKEAKRPATQPLPPSVAAVNGRGGDDSVRAAIAGLAERQRQVLFLRYYADLDEDTIARALGIRRGTVAATLHQAHAALRKQMGDR